MWHLFIPEVSISEKLLRAAIIYVFLYLSVRIFAKRQVAQMTPSDLVFLLIIANVVQNAVIGNDNSIGGGLVGAAAILVINWLINLLSFRSKRLRRLLESEPVLLIHDGRVLSSNMNRERVTMDALMAALRDSGVSDPLHVRAAVLEENGHISVLVNGHKS